MSKITNYLYISAKNEIDSLENLRRKRIELIINGILLSIFLPKSIRSKINTIHTPSIDSVLTPIPIKTLQTAVETALPVIESGGSVLIYCKHGRHRSVAIACCILISKGMSAEDAMNLVKERRKIADPRAQHIQSRIYQYEKIWRQQ